MSEASSSNSALYKWVQTVAAHTRPARIHWCDGSGVERSTLEREMHSSGSLLELDREAHPGSFLFRSDPSDAARTEARSFISTARPESAGPTNNWMSRDEARDRVWPLFAGAMVGRTMYVVPYLLGPPDSPYSRIGVEITDSPYVVLCLRIMTRMGRVALQLLGSSTTFVRGLHSLGDLSPDRRYIVHFPETSEIWSIGSGYGGDAILSKKSHSLRLASVQGLGGGWLAEHMSLFGLTSPEGRTHYVAAAFPSGAGKTDLATMTPTLPGWKVDTVGDDICWLHPGEDGRLWAINPENGMFGLLPGLNDQTDPNALFAAAHPNARYAVSLDQCPSATGTHSSPKGVPVSAIIFGTRRSKVTPLVYQTRSWRHGVYVGATMVSETTAATTGTTGLERNDPMGMLPFCGYNMGDYFAHWLGMERRLRQPPLVFHVNWFRTGDDGQLLWPGFGENIRVLKWILQRVNGDGGARETPIGLVPREDAIDLSGMPLSRERLYQLLSVDSASWLQEVNRSLEFFQQFKGHLPSDLLREHHVLAVRLSMHAN